MSSDVAPSANGTTVESGVPSQRVWHCPPPLVTDPRDDHDLIQQLPLFVSPPEEDEERQEFVHHTSILIGEDVRGRALARCLVRARRDVLRARRTRYQAWKQEQERPLWKRPMYQFAAALSVVVLAATGPMTSSSVQVWGVRCAALVFVLLLFGIRRATLESERRRFESRAVLDEELREASWRAFHGYFAETYGLSDETYLRDREWWGASLRAAHASFDRIRNEYFPITLRPHVTMSSEVASEQDPFGLIRLCLRKGKDLSSRIIRFEARLLLAITQIEFEMRLRNASPERLDEILARLTRKLDRDYFAPGESEHLMVIAELDPANNYRVKDFELVSRDSPKARLRSSRTRVVLPMQFRVIYVDGERILVAVLLRRKMDVWLKLVCKRYRFYESLTDLLGGKFIYLTREHVKAGVRHMRRTTVRAPGSVSGQASNAMRAGAVDTTNPHSSAEYEATKYDFTFHNERVEIQFMLLAHYIDELVSNGTLNHPFYKLRKYLDKLFPVIFPTELYGLDWRDPELRERFWQYLVGKI